MKNPNAYGKKVYAATGVKKKAHTKKQKRANLKLIVRALKADQKRLRKLVSEFCYHPAIADQLKRELTHVENMLTIRIEEGI